MKSKTEAIADTVVIATGSTLAVKPEVAPQFYETALWNGSVAVLGVTAVVLTIIHLCYAIRRDRKQNRDESQ